MKQIRLINIAGIDYKIFEQDNLTDDMKNPVWGITKYGQSSIIIDASLDAQHRDQTIIHEIVHTMLWEAGLDDYQEDEDLVTRLGNQIYQTLKNNKEFVEQL